MTFSGLHEARPLVLVAAGSAAEVTARLALAAPPLARSLGLPLLPALAPLQQPDRALALLAAAGSAGGLVWLGVDPGLALGDGCPWAQALGAWRQPTLLLLDVAQLDTGAAAATTALLRQHQVPLLGLIQWGEPWQPERRRLEALPWLGALAPDRPEGQDDNGLELRWALAAQGVVG
ncbi:MAG: hypothetical protein ACKO8I_18905 [Cyanobacteriota bacterium]